MDGQRHTSIYDKRDNFNFHVTNFSFLSSNISASPVYGVFLSHFIRYARACSSYECFILRAKRLSNRLLKQGYEIVTEEVLWSIRGSYQTIRSSSLTNDKWHSVAWPYTMTTLYRLDFIPFRDLLTKLDLLPTYCGWLYFRGYQFSLIEEKSNISGVQNSW